MRRKPVLVVSLVSLVIALFVWISQEEVDTSPPFVPLGTEDSAIQPELSVALETEGVELEEERLSGSVTSPSKTTASNFVHAPDEKVPSTPLGEKGLAAEKIKRAVESRDIKQAIDAFKQFGGCRKVVLTDSGMDRRKEILGNAYENMVISGETSISYDEIISSQDQVRSDCESLNKDRVDFLDRELVNEATNGNEIARFIYAMWSPNDVFSLQLGAELMVEYEATALEFTLENLNEGHPLGLYALGLSYSTGEYFTSQRISLGSAMLNASNICSGGQFNIDKQLGLNGLMIKAKARLQPIASEELMMDKSTQLYEAYCATSISNKMK